MEDSAHFHGRTGVSTAETAMGILQRNRAESAADLPQCGSRTAELIDLIQFRVDPLV